MKAETVRIRFEAPRGQSDAERCKVNGWTVGTQLVGDEGYGPTVIEITAIGEESILAKTISHNGDVRHARGEGNWTLQCRDWKVVAQ